MFDVEKVASAILKTISEPIKKLADRLKAVENRPIYDEKLVADMIDAAIRNHDEQIKLSLAESKSNLANQIALIDIPKLPDIPEMVSTFVKSAISELPKPKDGESVDMEVVKASIAEEVAKFVNSLPVPKDGIGIKTIDLDKDGNLTIEKTDGEKVELGCVVGKPGEDVDMAGLKKFIEETVASIPKPKDGVGASSATIDREGNLILVLTDGKTINLGPVVGKDADMNLVERIVEEKVAVIPRPKDGLDGLGFDDLSIEYDEKRSFTFKFKNAEKEKEFKFKIPSMIYLGIYDKDKSYEVGDVVTWGGSAWHCNKDTNAKPGESRDWQLAVKRGIDGKEVVKVSNSNKEPVKV